MEIAYKTYSHNPPHLFIGGAKYWVTGSCYKHSLYFADPSAKEKMIEILMRGCQKYNWKIDDWVILNDHYHLMLQSSTDGDKTIEDIIRNFHKFSSMWIRKNSVIAKADKIFWNYWDTCITYEKSYYTRLNYLYYNPVKHGYVERAEDYQFGSFYFRWRENREYLENLKGSYPFDRLDLE